MQGQGLGDWPCASNVCQPDAFFNQTFNYDVASSFGLRCPRRARQNDGRCRGRGRRELRVGLTKKMGKSEPESGTEQDRERMRSTVPKRHVKVGISQTPWFAL